MKILRKTFKITKEKSIYIEFSKLKMISFSMLVDGPEKSIGFTFCLYLFFHIKFNGFLPKFMVPSHPHKSIFSNKIIDLPEKRVISLSSHHDFTTMAIYWRIWTLDGEWNSKTPKWRDGSIDFHKIIFGKHESLIEEIECKEYIIDFVEGPYRVSVSKMIRTDSWQRKRDRKMLLFDIKCLDLIPTPESKWIGEEYSSDHHITLSSFFDGKFKSMDDAFKYYQDKLVKQRIESGGDDWVPKKHIKRIKRNKSIDNLLG